MFGAARMAIYTRINAIAFDIGGVLLEIDKTELELLLNHSGITSDDFFDEEFIYLQRGLIDPDQFFFNKSKKTKIATFLLREAFINMIPKKTHAFLLEHLTLPYFFMSNINQLHFEKLTKDIQLSTFCRRHSVLSYQVGHLKPSTSFFECLNIANLAPDSILFIDDKKENLRAASHYGLVALECLTSKNLPHLLELVS